MFLFGKAIYAEYDKNIITFNEILTKFQFHIPKKAWIIAKTLQINLNSYTFVSAIIRTFLIYYYCADVP